MKNLDKVIKGCLKNKRSCQEELFKWLNPKLMGVALRMAPDDDKANDLLQDSFIKIFGNLHTLKGYEPAVVYSWAKRIVTCTIIDYHRKYKFENCNVESVDSDFGSRSGSQYHNFGWNGDIAENNVDDSYMEGKKITPEMVMSALKTLTPQYKLVFNLYVMEGYSHGEIGERLDISIGTSKSNLSRAKVKIRKEIELCQ